MFKKNKEIPTLWFSFIILAFVCIILKSLIARPRPFGLVIFLPYTNYIEYSFPSLHAAVVLFALIILFKELPKYKLFFGIIGILIIFSRIYLKVHYLSDIIGGAIIGLIFANFYLKNLNLRGYHIIKRVFDFFTSLFLLIILAPILIIIGFFILIFTGSPILFEQDRIGKDGNIFTVHKFRTMVIGAANFQKEGTNIDKLITKVGKVLRPLYLDELPQLWNVLKGDMSLIGPRPLQPFELFNTKFAKDKKVVELTKLRPGLTGLESAIDYLNKKEIKTIEKELGLWKVDNKIKDFDKHRLLLNLYYIRHESFIIDIKIIWWTIKSLFEHLLKINK